MSAPDLTVFLVDDDPAVRDALGLLLGLRGYRTAPFACAEDFLTAWRPDWAGCLVVDIRMPGMDGLALQRRLKEQGARLPVVVITGHGDIGSARAAFRAEAVDFLEKPLDDDRLVAAIDEAFARQEAARAEAGRRQDREALFAALTPRERDVIEQAAAGRHNRDIAAALAISVRTVEVHKARAMAKLGVRNLSELIRLVLG